MSMLVVRMRMWMDVGVKGVRMLLLLLLLSVAAIVMAVTVAATLMGRLWWRRYVCGCYIDFATQIFATRLLAGPMELIEFAGAVGQLMLQLLMLLLLPLQLSLLLSQAALLLLVVMLMLLLLLLVEAIILMMCSCIGSGWQMKLVVFLFFFYFLFFGGEKRNTHIKLVCGQHPVKSLSPQGYSIWWTWVVVCLCGWL